MLDKEGVESPLHLVLGQDELSQLLRQQSGLVLESGDSSRASLKRGLLQAGVASEQALTVPVPLLMGESNEGLVREGGERLWGVEGRNEGQGGGDHQATEQLQGLRIVTQQDGPSPIVDADGRVFQKREEADASANLTGEGTIRSPRI